jgi:hypothetical protein
MGFNANRLAGNAFGSKSPTIHLRVDRINDGANAAFGD